MPPHSKPLPPLYPQRVLACFSAGFGILIIGGKEEISAPTGPNNRPPSAAFSFSGGKPWQASAPRCNAAIPPTPRGTPRQKAPARIPFSATCHSPKQPSQNSLQIRDLPQSHGGRGEGVGNCRDGSRAANRPPTGSSLPAPSSRLQAAAGYRLLYSTLLFLRFLYQDNHA